MTLLLLTGGVVQGQWWSVQASGIDTNLRAVSAVLVSPEGDGTVAVWASGSNGVILRSLDRGKSWKRLHVQGGDALDFRGISAVGADVAYVMSIGNGEQSRIYKTIDGGATWQLQFTGSRKETFLDSISCDSEKNCLVLGDPVGGKFLLLSTEDGEHWKELPRDQMPEALPNEGAFAASNSSLFVEDANIYFGTGGAAKARIFHSSDSGRTWTITDTPIASGNASSGIFSIDCKGGRVLLAVGGDYTDPARPFHSAAVFRDSDSISRTSGTWQLAKQQPGGFRSGVAQFYGAAAVAVGPNGEDVSLDFGATWQHTDSLNLNAVTILDTTDGWAVGPKGTIARFINHLQYEIRNRDPRQDSAPEAVHAHDFPAAGIDSRLFQPDEPRTFLCLPDLACLGTLPRSLHSDFTLRPPTEGAERPLADRGGSSTGRQDANHLH